MDKKGKIALKTFLVFAFIFAIFVGGNSFFVSGGSIQEQIDSGEFVYDFYDNLVNASEPYVYNSVGYNEYWKNLDGTFSETLLDIYDYDGNLVTADESYVIDRTSNGNIIKNPDGTFTKTIGQGIKYIDDKTKRHANYVEINEVVKLNKSLNSGGEKSTEEVLELELRSSNINLTFVGLNPAGKEMPTQSANGIKTIINYTGNGYKWGYRLRLPNDKFKARIYINSDSNFEYDEKYIYLDDMKLSFDDVLDYNYTYTLEIIDNKTAYYEISRDWKNEGFKNNDWIWIDPTVTLEVTSDVADVFLRGDFDYTIIKFNISSLSSNIASILTTNLSLTVSNMPSGPPYTVGNLSLYRVDNQTWNESTNINELKNYDWFNYSQIDISGYESPDYNGSDDINGQTINIDATLQTRSCVVNSDNYCSYGMILSENYPDRTSATSVGTYTQYHLLIYNESGIGEKGITFRSREYPSTSTPKLTITYTPYIDIISPTPSQIFAQNSPTAIFNIETEIPMDTCYWSEDSGITNHSLYSGIIKNNTNFTISANPTGQINDIATNGSDFFLTDYTGRTIYHYYSNMTYSGTSYDVSDFAGNPDSITWNGTTWFINAYDVVYLYDKDFNKLATEYTGLNIAEKIFWNGSVFFRTYGGTGDFDMYDSEFSVISERKLRAGSSSSPAGVFQKDNLIYVMDAYLGTIDVYDGGLNFLYTTINSLGTEYGDEVTGMALYNNQVYIPNLADKVFISDFDKRFLLTNTTMVDGPHTITYSCNDTTNNWHESESVSFDVDSTNITICRDLTRTVTYQIQNNLSSSGTCLEDVADTFFPLRIDGNGYTIFGDGTGIGIYESDYKHSLSDTQIDNVSINGFEYGMKFNSGKRGDLTNNRLINNTYGMSFSNMNSAGMRVTNNYFENNTQGGGASVYTDFESNIFNNNSIGLYAGGAHSIKTNIFYGNDIGFYTGGAEIINLYRNNFTENSEGIRLYLGKNNNFTSNIYNSNTIAITLTRSSDDNIFTDNTFFGSTSYDVYFELYGAGVHNDNNRFINSTFASGKLNSDYGTNTSLEWYFQPTINYLGSPLQSATVNIYDLAGNLVVSELTDSNGLIPKQNLNEYINNLGVITYYTNHTMNVSKVGYTTNSTSYNLTTLTNEFPEIEMQLANSAPTATLISPVDNSFSDSLANTITINTADSDSNLKNITIIVWLDGAEETRFKKDITGATNSTEFTDYGFVYSDGYEWNGYVCDDTNICSFAVANFTLTTDTIIPLVSLTLPINTTYSTIQTSLKYTQSDTNTDSCWYSLDNGATNSSRQDCGLNWTGLSSGQGSSTWTVYSNDSANNLNSSSVIFFVDSINPLITLIAPTNNTFSSTDSIPINITLTETNFKNVTYYLTGTETNTTTFSALENITFVSLSEGKYQYYVEVRDILNNLNTSEIRTYTVDLNAPAITLNLPANNTNTSTTSNNLTATLTDAIGIKNATLNIYNYGGGSILSSPITYAEGVTNAFIGVIYSFSNGIFTWFYEAFDWAGQSTTSGNFTITIDDIAPVVNIVYPLNETSYNFANFTINYTYSDATIGIDSCWYTNDTGVNNYSISCGQNISANLSEGTFTYNIFSNDTLNNIGSDSVTFSISLGAPAITLNSPTSQQYFNSGTGIYFNYTATDVDGLDTCKLYGDWTGTWHNNYTWINPNSGVMNWTTVDVSEGSYKFAVECNDTLDTLSITNNRTFTVDETTPVIEYGDGTKNSYSNLSQNFIYVNTTWTEINFQNITFTLYNDTEVVNKTTYTNSVYYINWTGLSDNNYTYEVNITDKANNQNGTELRYITIDDTNPFATLGFPLNNSYNNTGTINFTTDITDNIGIKNATLIIQDSENSWLNFDGENDYVQTISSDELNLSQSYSMSVWFKGLDAGQDYANPSGSSVTFMWRQDDAPSMGLTSSYFIRTSFNNGTTYYRVLSVTSANDDEWNHALATYNITDGNLSVYLNGVISSSGIYHGGNLGADGNIFRFGRDDAGRLFNGSLDEIRIYNTTLSQFDITEIYSSGLNSNSSIPTDGLVSWYDFEDVGNSILSDKFGSNDGTINGATWNNYNSTTTNFLVGVTTKTLGTVLYLADSVYSWFYNIFDWSGNSYVTDNKTITIDTIAPQLVDNGFSPAIVYNNDTVTIQANASNTHIDTVWIRINKTGTYENITVTENDGTTYNYTLGSSDIQNFENISWIWYVNDTATNMNLTAINSFLVSNRNPYNTTISFPDNDTYLNKNNTLIDFTSSDYDGDNITYELMFSYNGTAFESFGTTTNNSINFTGLNDTEGAIVYYYIIANDTQLSNTSETRILNFDKTSPSGLSIVRPFSSPVPQCSLVNIEFNYTYSDDNIDYCTVNMTSSGVTTYPHTTIPGCINTTVYSTIDNSVQTLTLTAIDKAGNTNTSQILLFFNTANPGCAAPYVPPAGGGGGATIIIGGEAQWSMETEVGSGKYEIRMVRDSSKTKPIVFSNLGGQSVIVGLSCLEISGSNGLCKYISFEQDSVSLPLSKEIDTYVDFVISLDELVENGDYTFNIVAKDADGNEGVLTIEVNVESDIGVNFIANKLSSSKDAGGIQIPYLFIFLFSIVLIFFLLVTIRRLLKIEIPGWVGISAVLSFIISIGVIIFI